MKTNTLDIPIPLAERIEVQGRALKQLQRSDRAALYELRGSQGYLYGYEVIVIKVRPAEQIFTKFYPCREVYPANEEWGTLAWSYPDSALVQAQEAFTELTASFVPDNNA
jgi:hypothetical protein